MVKEYVCHSRKRLKTNWLQQKKTWGFAVSSVKVISSGSTWMAALLCEGQCRLLQCQRKNSRRRVGLGAGAPTLHPPQTPYSSGVSLLLRSPEPATSRGDCVNFLPHDRCHAIRFITLYVRKNYYQITITWFPSRGQRERRITAHLSRHQCIADLAPSLLWGIVLNKLKTTTF
jgi:hypothetical protein